MSNQNKTTESQPNKNGKIEENLSSDFSIVDYDEGRIQDYKNELNYLSGKSFTVNAKGSYFGLGGQQNFDKDIATEPLDPLRQILQSNLDRETKRLEFDEGKLNSKDLPSANLGGDQSNIETNIYQDAEFHINQLSKSNRITFYTLEKQLLGNDTSSPALPNSLLNTMEQGKDFSDIMNAGKEANNDIWNAVQLEVKGGLSLKVGNLGQITNQDEVDSKIGDQAKMLKNQVEPYFNNIVNQFDQYQDDLVHAKYDAIKKKAPDDKHASDANQPANPPKNPLKLPPNHLDGIYDSAEADKQASEASSEATQDAKKYLDNAQQKKLKLMHGLLTGELINKIINCNMMPQQHQVTIVTMH